jgi:hypothetical protein
VAAVSNWQYWWSFTFIQYTVYAGMAISVAILLFLGVSAGVVARRTKHGGPKRLTVERLNRLVADRLNGVAEKVVRAVEAGSDNVSQKGGGV